MQFTKKSLEHFKIIGNSYSKKRNMESHTFYLVEVEFCYENDGLLKGHMLHFIKRQR